MNFLKGNGRQNFRSVIVVLFFAALILVWPHPAHADGVVSTIFGWLFGSATALADIAANFVGWLAYLVSYFISSIAAIFIALEAYVVNVILQLNGNVVNTLAVQAGFQVTLAIANLGFVLGIIVIAIMTILRRETYGIKSLLWKLVLAAILVNFSLVIGGAIINFANQLTLAFMGNLPGAGAGVQTANTWSGLSIPFADNLAGAFAPHKIGLSGFLDTTSGLIQKGSADNFGSALAKIITAVFSVVFVVFMLIAIIIVLLVFILMLLIRYVYLTILLILMPIAWLFWIFPKLSHHWDKWWSQFFRWTFFAPIVIFFLYLALATASLMSNAQGQGNIAGPEAGIAGLGYQPSTNNKALAAVSGVLGGFANTLIGTFLQMFVVIGLAVGGMIAADKMSIKGAGVAVGAMQTVANKTKGYAWDKTKQTGRWAARKAGIDTAVKRMRGGEVGVGAFKKVPFVGTAADWAVKRGASVVGRAVEPALGNKDLVEKAKRAVPDDPEKIKENLRGNMNTQDNLAHIAKLIEKGEFSEDLPVKGRKAKDYLDENKELFEEGYGQGKMLKDANKALRSDKEMRDAEREIIELASAGKNTAAAMKKLEDATEKFVEKMEKGDAAKINVNEHLGKDTPLTRAFLRRLALSAPQLVPGMLPRLKSKNLKEFDRIYREVIAKEITAARMAGNTTIVDHLAGTKMVKGKPVLSEDSVLGRYNRSYASNVTGFVGAGFGGGAGGAAGGGTPSPTGTP